MPLISARVGNRVLWVMIKLPSEPDLLKKYDIPVPRYTSYPTIPYWDSEKFTSELWVSSVKKIFDETNGSNGISLYVHLPFCENLCTYCACNTRITKNHKVEVAYIQALVKEWNTYKRIFGGKPVIRELHLGGGTPTFFSSANLRWLLTELFYDATIHEQHEFSFEGHPNNTTADHLQTLFDLGFTRVSFGVQDLDEKVQKTINRIQPFGNLQRVTRTARDIGYQSVNFDLIYGLPFQTPSTIINTFEKVLTLRPDRVSFYSYAHVPWMKPGQRGYEDTDLPSDVVKRLLYETGREMLKYEGYEDIGMDHFALANDSMFHAQANGMLHRNFMGYTTKPTDLLIGLGCSAISDAKYAYAQNIKKVEEYSEVVFNDALPILNGHIHTSEDLHLKKCILEVACHGKITSENLIKANDASIRRKLNTFCDEGILISDCNGGYTLTEPGRAFVRNICSAFDLHLSRQKKSFDGIFSKAI